MTARDKIKPLFDVPLTFQLEQIDGQEVPSKFTGLEYRFSIIFENNPAYIYLPQEGRNAILSARPQPGDLIELVKQKSGNQLYFKAQVLGDGYDDAPPAAPRGVRMVAPQSRHNGSYYNAEDIGPGIPPPAPQRATRRALPPATQPTPPPALPPPPTNGRAGQTFGQAMPPRPEAVNLSPLTQQIAGCLRVAFDAWEETRAYARGKGVDLNYTSEDVRSTGISIYINCSSSRDRGNGGGR